MMGKPLPEIFDDLAPFAVLWACGSSMERDLNRLDRPEDEMKGFYDAMSPRIDAVLEYLNQFDLATISGADETLLNLAFAYAEVAHSVELKWLGMFDERRVIETIALS